MATEREWANGFYQQARADLRAAKHLDGREASVSAMLLQMVLEKFGKAALLRSRAYTVASAQATHKAASAMVTTVFRNTRVCGRLGWSPGTVRVVIRPLVKELEDAQPKNAVLAGFVSGPWLEYPWEHQDQVKWPAQHHPLGREFNERADDRKRLFRFASDLDAHFDDVFPP